MDAPLWGTLLDGYVLNKGKWLKIKVLSVSA